MFMATQNISQNRGVVHVMAKLPSFPAESRGRIQKAPENFLSPAHIADVTAGRRGFLRGAFAAASGMATWTVSRPRPPPTTAV